MKRMTQTGTTILFYEIFDSEISIEDFIEITGIA
jgi:hypothetical protein